MLAQIGLAFSTVGSKILLAQRVLRAVTTI